jgi:signal transduction histidine kinase
VARECALALYGFTVRENMRAKRKAEENLRRSEEKLRDSQKLEAVATLAGGIAHDFHNLITAIFAFTSVAKDTLAFDHPAAGAIDNVEEAARQASGITKSLLVFTRKTRSERRPLDLAQFIPRAVRFVHGVLPNNIRLECEIDSRTPLWIEADESQLHQVIMNLVVNARDAMPDGGEIRIRVARPRSGHPHGNGKEISRAEDRVMVEVCDTGVGMSDEVRRRAFEPFYTTLSRDKGTGLGLSIVRGIVQDNGGTIDLESGTATGTRLELNVPACAPAPPMVGAPRLSASTDKTGFRILVADDNDMIRAGLSTCLIQEGFEVVQAKDGEVFQEIIQESGERIDLIVLDLDMPGMDGVECLSLLEREGIRLPVILVTGKPVSRFDRVTYPDVALLKKPFGIPGFMQTVNELLATRREETPKAERLSIS